MRKPIRVVVACDLDFYQQRRVGCRINVEFCTIDGRHPVASLVVLSRCLPGRRVSLPVTGTKLRCLVTGTCVCVCVCEELAQRRCLKAERPRVELEPVTSKSQIGPVSK